MRVYFVGMGALVGCATATDGSTATSDTSAPLTGPWRAVQVETVASLSGADGLLLLDDGRLVVSDPAGNELRFVDPATGADTPFVDALQEPYGITADADGNVLVANWAAQNALSVAPDGSTDVFATTSDRFGNVYVDSPTGDVYLPSFQSGLLERITSDGTRETLSKGQVGAGLHAVMFDDERTLYTGYVLTGEIHRHDDAGVGSLFATLPGRLGNLLWYDGRLYATGWDTHRVYTIDENGEVTTFAGRRRPGTADGAIEDARFESPNGLVVDPAASVMYVSESQGRVRRITLERTPASPGPDSR